MLALLNYYCVVSRLGNVVGGAEEDRTPDLLRARQALSQLSYGPGVVLFENCRLHASQVKGVVGLGGFEPPTSPLSGVRSIQLSYRPRSDALYISINSIETLTNHSCGWLPLLRQPGVALAFFQKRKTRLTILKSIHCELGRSCYGWVCSKMLANCHNSGHFV